MRPIRKKVGLFPMSQPRCTPFEAVSGTVSMTALFLFILTFRVGHVAGFVPSLGFRATCHNSLCLVPSSRLWGMTESQVEAIHTGDRLNNPPGKLLVHWRGEDVEGYSLQFRHLELHGALSAAVDLPLEDISKHLQFRNALNYTGQDDILDVKRERFDQGMQYLNCEGSLGNIPRDAFIKTAERCSLVHALYEIVAEADTYEELATTALENHGFDDMRVGNENEDATWCFRVRHYGESSGSKQEYLRYGESARSITKEREALKILTPLLITFGGSVDLQDPDVKIYVFDGLQGESGKVTLARRIAVGPKTSIMDPNTRICETNTPLCPIAAFSLCNVAGLRKDQTILDPYAGSGAIMLAAAMIEPTCRSVGVEIAHDGLVNREDIRKDFSTRGLAQPLALLRGDSTKYNVRAEAREAIGNRPFDYIISDPPYGVRESTIDMDPIVELLRAIKEDRGSGQPLLKKGGKLVCFIPCQEEENFFEEVLPDEEQLRDAGLRCEVVREQPLNKKLSRWLASFVCVR